MSEETKEEKVVEQETDEITPPPESNTLLIEDSPALRKLLGQNLEIYTATNVRYIYDADKAIEHLKQNEDINLIVCKDMIGEENTSLKVYYFVKSQKLGIPIILFGENPKLMNEVDMVDARDWRKAIKLAGKHLGVTAKQMAYQQMDDYYSIPIKSLLSMTSTPVKIYQVIDGGYSQIYNPGDNIDLAKTQEMLVAGEKYVFVRSSDRLEITKTFSEQAHQVLIKELSNEDRMAATGASYETAQTLINDSGLSPEAVELSKATIDSMHRMASGSDGLSELLELVTSSNESYLYKHSLLISIIGCHTISKIEWGNQGQKDKLCFMAFFHDVTLGDDELCKINSTSALKEAKLKPELEKKINNHALDACELLKDYPGIPFGAESLILQHHGTTNGVGFADSSMDNRIAPLSILFRVVEEYVDELLRYEGSENAKFSPKATVEEIKKKFNVGAYSKTARALEEAVLGID